MPKLTLLCILICLTSITARSQQLLKGRVLENKTRVGLAGINVQNLSTKQTTVTDNAGRFTIKGSLNNLLLFKGFAYQNDTLMVIKLNEFEVFMLPQEHMLNDVKVTGMDGPSMVIYDPYFHGQTTAYQTDAGGNFKGGLNFRFWYWKKDEKKRKRYEKMLRDDAVRAQIAKAFTPQNIAAYVPLKGIELINFISKYTPGIKQFKDDNFVLTSYLNDCYKKFIQLPLNVRQAAQDSSIFIIK